MPIVIHQNLPLAATQGVTAPVVLQPGSVIGARVQQILGNDTVVLAIAGQLIEAQSQVPLQAGQVLQLAVSQGPGGSIGLAIVGQPSSAAPNQGPAAATTATVTTDFITLAGNASAIIAAQPTPATATTASSQLTALEALAVVSAAQSAATQQTSLAQLFSNLSVATQLGGLPPQVQQAVAQLLARRMDVTSGLTGDDFSQAFQNSGLFLEASLATGSLASATPDLKAALIVLRQVLATSLDSATVAPPPGSPVSAGSNGSTQPAAPVSTPGAAAEPQRSPAVVTSPAPSASMAVSPTAAAPGAPQPGKVAALVLPEVTPAEVEMFSPAGTITAGSAALELALAPLLASATAAPAAIDHGPVPFVTGLASSPANSPGMATAVLSSPVAPADAAARAAAGLAALNLLQESTQTSSQVLAQASGLASVFMLQRSQMLALLPGLNGARSPETDDAEFAHTNLPPPPLSGALPAAQPVLPATLLPHSSAQAMMQQLLADTNGAIARQTLLQVASLPGQADDGAARLGASGPRWNFEIPLALPQGTAMAQFEISRDGGDSPASAARRVWRARFSLDVEPAGPIHALVSLSGDRTSVRMWAERPATVAQLREGVAHLGQALKRADLRLGDIVVQEGAPLAPAAARAGHFLDRAL